MKLFGSKKKKQDEEYEAYSDLNEIYEDEPEEFPQADAQDYPEDPDYPDYPDYPEDEWEEPDRRGRKNKKNRKKKKSKGKIVAIVIIIVAILAVAAVAAWDILVKPPALEEKPGTAVETQAPETDAPASETPDEEWAITASGRKTYCHTFVLAALDEVSENTDTIMIGMLDRKEGTFSMCSIPRDTLVNVSWSNCVNTLYKNSDDPDQFKDYLADLLGFRVDSYAIVDINAVAHVVDAIGGVDYNVPINMNYDDPTQDLHIHINAGEQHLNGEDAVKVIRWRQNNDGTGYTMGDIDRIKTQQDFLMTVFKQMLSVGNIPNLSKAAKVFAEDVTTDLTASNVVWYGKELLKLDSENIHFMTVPGNQSAMMVLSGGVKKSIVSIYPDEWVTMINTYLNPFVQDVTKEDLNILTFEGADPYNSIGVFRSTSGTIASDYFNTWNAYNGG